MTCFITLKGEFKTDLAPDFVSDNEDLIKSVFKKTNFNFDSFNFYQHVLTATVKLDRVFITYHLPKLFEIKYHQADFTRLLSKMRETNTKFHLMVKSLDTILPEYLDQDVDLIVDDNLELRAVNIHVFNDYDSEYDLITRVGAQGILLNSPNEIKENRAVLLTKLAQPISQIKSVRTLNLTPDEIINRIVYYVQTQSRYNGGLLYDHYKTNAKAVMWFYEGLHSEFQ